MLKPEIVVAPPELAFGDRAVPLAAIDTIYVSNDGRAPLEVTATIEDEAGVFTVDTSSATISSKDTAPFAVTFAPATYLDYTAELVFTSNDEETPELRVPLSGSGISAPMPDIQISDLSLEFDATTSPSVIVTVKNVGEAPLVLGDLLLAGSGAFALVTDPSGNTLAPGDEFPLVVSYAPATTDGDNGSIRVPSNDPDEPEVEIVLLGNGGADYEYPVAVIDCPGGEIDPPRFVTITDDGSYDPEGHDPLTYSWELIHKPENAHGVALSDGYLTNAVGTSTELWADAVGLYTVQLVVENALGVRSAPARCTITAKPAEDILVELTWSTPKADLDLHLATNDAKLFQKPYDASYCNRNAEWGEVGPADDAHLDLDDKSGLGPENMSITSPADGDYEVRVHYFDDHGDDVVTATVRVYLAGALQPALESSRNLSRNQVWDVTHIRWPEATAAALPGEPYDTARRSCYAP